MVSICWFKNWWFQIWNQHVDPSVEFRFLVINDQLISISNWSQIPRSVLAVEKELIGSKIGIDSSKRPESIVDNVNIKVSKLELLVLNSLFDYVLHLIRDNLDIHFFSIFYAHFKVSLRFVSTFYLRGLICGSFQYFCWYSFCKYFISLRLLNLPYLNSQVKRPYFVDQ